jgi:DNA-binding NarL/FixJ family response regulator
MIETERKSQCLAICRDLRMPELDGMGLYEELAQHYPHLLSRLIFLTGDTLNAETTRLLEQVGAPRLS